MKKIIFLMLFSIIGMKESLAQSCVEDCMNKWNPITEYGKLVECTLSCGGVVGETLGGLYNQVYNAALGLIGMGDKATESTLKDFKTSSVDELKEVNGSLEEVNNNIKVLRDHNAKYREVMKSHTAFFATIKGKINDPSNGFLAISNNTDKLINQSKVLLGTASCKFATTFSDAKNTELDVLYKRKEVEVSLFRALNFDKTGVFMESESGSSVKMESQYGSMLEGERTMLIKQLWENIQNHETAAYVILDKVQKSCYSGKSTSDFNADTKVRNMSKSYQQHNSIELIKQFETEN